MELSSIAEESARGSFSLMVGIAASTVAAALAAILIARLLGPGGYGQYGLAFVVPALFVSIADFGITPALTRYGASLRSQSKFRKLASMIGSGVLFNLVVDFVAFLLVLWLSGLLAATLLHRPAMGQLVALASFVILFQGLFNVSYNSFVGLDRMGQGALMLVLRDTTRVILSPLLIIMGFGVAGAIGGQIFGWVLASLLGAWLLLVVRRVLQSRSGVTELEDGVASDVRTMMSYGLPLYFGSLVTTVLAQYQNIVLAFFTSNTEIGNLNAAVNFGALVAVVATPIADRALPGLLKA